MIAIRIAAVVLLAAVVSAQEPFRAGVRVVPVYATVRDSDGHLALNLTKADFQILDNGQPVPIALFSSEEQPITVAVMIDPSDGNGEVYERKRDGMLSFIGALRADDRARIGTFSGSEIAISAKLTGDKRELERVMAEEFWGGWPLNRPVWRAIGLGMDSLASAQGRRVVLLLTNGEDLSSSRPAVLSQLQRRITVEDFMLYVITFDSTPLVSTLMLMKKRGDLPDLTGNARALKALADVTGGGYVAAPGALRISQAMANVVEELRHQYTLGFVPAQLDGAMHTIQVKTRGGLAVSSRQNYFANKP